MAGNAATATKLATARTIAISGKVTATGVNFDGSDNITLSTTAANILSSEVSDATNANTANMIVKRDADGNFSAGTITAALAGNAATATKLYTARTINGVSFDGSSNITVTAATPNALTIGTGLTGTTGTFDGSSGVTISLTGIAAGSESVGALKYNGTTASNGTFNGSTTSPTNTTRLNYEGYFYASKVYNAVWGDLVDFLEFNSVIDIEYGKAYTRDKNYNIVKTSKLGQRSIGIASDTYGFAMGDRSIKNQIPIAVAGFVLAYVDKQYKFGTPLIATKNGMLTKARCIFDKSNIIAIYDRPETSEKWNNIIVNSRHWIKVI